MNPIGNEPCVHLQQARGHRQRTRCRSLPFRRRRGFQEAVIRSGSFPSPESWPFSASMHFNARKGRNGVSTNGVTATFMFFDRVNLWVLPLTYFYLPKSARVYLFPQSVKIHYFCSGPISVDPIYLSSAKMQRHRSAPHTAYCALARGCLFHYNDMNFN